MEFIYAAAALVIGIILGYLIARFSVTREKAAADARVAEAEKQLIAEQGRTARETAVLEEKFRATEAERVQTLKQLEQTTEQRLELSRQLAVAETENKNLAEKIIHQKEELQALQEKLTSEFENIAQRILKMNAQELQESSQGKLSDMLLPLRERLEKFEKKVEETYDKEYRETLSLKQEVSRLAQLNTEIMHEAGSLSRALRGDTKKQWDWGEVVLERILEKSGLIKGEEYITQFSTTNEDDDTIRPDVLILLPEKKHIIIDAKVSLKAYDACVNSDNPEEKAAYLRQHVESVRNHIKLLAGKNYHDTPGLNSPDFVLLFMPIESSFSMAIQQEVDLFSQAWEKNIVIVSPSTLLATLRTIAGIWRHEKQNRNALEIARVAGTLFNKFEGFLKDMSIISAKLNDAQDSYQNAMSKLTSGKGNVVSTINRLKILGAKTSKEINTHFEEFSDSEETGLMPENPS